MERLQNTNNHNALCKKVLSRPPTYKISRNKQYHANIARAFTQFDTGKNWNNAMIKCKNNKIKDR